MKQYTRIALAVLLLCAVIAVVPAVRAQQTPAATESDLRRMCTQAQGYLQTTVRSRDIRTRVDRLQAYQYISKRLDTFIRRLERHEQPRAEEMRELTASLDRSIEDFKRHYEQYDVSRDRLAGLRNCQQQPAEFSKHLQRTRENLATVEKDTKTINDLLAKDLPRELRQLKQELVAVEEEAGDE